MGRLGEHTLWMRSRIVPTVCRRISPSDRTRLVVAAILLWSGLTTAIGVIDVHPATASGAAALWTQFSPGSPPCTSTCSSSPPPRYAAAMAYDSATSQLILFGGFNNSGLLNDTWAWNGKAWAQVADASDLGCTSTCVASPSARGYATMAYDPATSQLVLFGGRSPERADTWAWDGNMWTQLTPSTNPTARDSAVMAFDASTQSLVLFGGDDGTTVRNDTWAWNGTTWTQLDDSPLGCTNNCASSPPGRQLAAMAPDPVGGGTVLFGGETGNNVSSNRNDTWVWSGTAWTQANDNPAGCTNDCASSPPARQAASMVDDAVPGADQILLFGGLATSGSDLGDTWTWSPTPSWTQASPSASPGPRDTATMAFDGATLQTVLFGGESPNLNDTWTYGTAAPTVSKLSPNSGPSGGGTVVIVTGSNLAGATAAHFGSKAAHVDKTVSASEIQVTSPKGSGTVDVTVTTAHGTSHKTGADHFSYTAGPTVSKLSPNSGPSGGGTVIKPFGLSNTDTRTGCPHNLRSVQ